MTRAIYAKRFVMIFGILTLFFITGMTSTAVTGRTGTTHDRT
ncbi:MAG: hypothetical protein ACOC38_05700 [Promethearchaeia archaeon]